MSELIDLQEQIKALQKQAADVRARDFNETVKDIQAKMMAFGITPKDLAVTQRKPRKVKEQSLFEKPVKAKAVRTKASGKAVEPKYIGPEGQTWSGRGLSPKWLAVLVTQGSKREDFLIQKSQPGTAPAPV